jgi:hypothetical protein
MKTKQEKKDKSLTGALKNLLEKICTVHKKKNEYPFALQPIPVKKPDHGLPRS